MGVKDIITFSKCFRLLITDVACVIPITTTLETYLQRLRRTLELCDLITKFFTARS